MFWMLPLLTGLGTWAATGDFKKGILGAALGMIPGLSGLGGAAASTAAKTGIAGIGSALPTAATAGKAAALASSAITPATAAGAGGLAAMATPATTAAASGGAGSGILRAGLNFAKAHPMAATMLASTVLGGLGGGDVETPESKPHSGGDEKATPRKIIPFPGANIDTASTYTPGQTPDPNDIYRYGQYGGEHTYFDSNPGTVQLEQKEGDLDLHPRTFAVGGHIQGPGDGMSDSVPMTGPGGQPFALSDGEFVLPADVVAALGAGSNKAGAERLHSMMSSVRRQAYGKGGQIKPVRNVSI